MGPYIDAENFLYLGKRRVSQRVFRQLPLYGATEEDGPIIGWVGGTFHLTSSPVGRVNYHWAGCKERNEHAHLIVRPPDSPVGSLDGLRHLWLEASAGWEAYRLTKECADRVGVFTARHGYMQEAEFFRWQHLQREWRVFYERLSRLPVL